MLCHHRVIRSYSRAATRTVLLAINTSEWHIGTPLQLRKQYTAQTSSAIHLHPIQPTRFGCSNQNFDFPCHDGSIHWQQKRQQKRDFSSVASKGTGDGYASTSTKASPAKQRSRAAASVHSTAAKSNEITEYSVAQSKALHRAVLEADQLSQLVKTSPVLSRKTENTEGKSSELTAEKKDYMSPSEDLYRMRLEDANKTCKTLLRISNIQPLVDDIRDHNDSERVAKVHRAFISVVTWCLSLVTINAADTPLTGSKRAAASLLMEKLLEVVRRAHKLDLPLHIPLYQRLLEQVAVHSAMMKKTDPVDAILDISMYATKSLDLTSSPTQASEEWLEPLVDIFLIHPYNKENPRLDHVERLLDGMGDCLGIKKISFDATLDLLLRLRAIFRKALKDPKKVQYANEAASIVQWLEPSLVNMLNELNQEPIFPSPSSPNKKENLLHDMLLWDQENPNSQDSYALIMSRILRWGSPIRLIDDIPGPNRRKIHPFDIIADTILTRDLQDFRAKELASDILQFVRLCNSSDENDDLPELKNAFSSPSSNTIPTSRSDPLISSLSSEADLDINQRSSFEFQDYYDDHFDDDFPDISGQMIEWSPDARPLEYTPEYKAAIGFYEDQELEELPDPEYDAWDDDFDEDDDFSEDFDHEDDEDDEDGDSGKKW